MDPTRIQLLAFAIGEGVTACTKHNPSPNAGEIGKIIQKIKDLNFPQNESKDILGENGESTHTKPVRELLNLLRKLSPVEEDGKIALAAGVMLCTIAYNIQRDFDEKVVSKKEVVTC